MAKRDCSLRNLHLCCSNFAGQNRNQYLRISRKLLTVRERQQSHGLKTKILTGNSTVSMGKTIQKTQVHWWLDAPAVS